jgi:hypothetical protein
VATAHEKTELEITAILHRDVAITAEDEVIDQLDIEELGRAGEPTCVSHVLVGWLRVTGRVVVEHDDAFRVLAERPAEDVTGAHEGGVQRADEDLALRDDAATCVEEQRAETFLHFSRVPRGEATSVRLKGVERAGRRRCESATTKLDRGGESPRIVVRDVCRTAQNAVDERRETVAEERARTVEVFVGRHTLAREECDELRVAERVHTMTLETHGRPLVVSEATACVTRRGRDREWNDGDVGGGGRAHVRLRG